MDLISAVRKIIRPTRGDQAGGVQAVERYQRRGRQPRHPDADHSHAGTGAATRTAANPAVCTSHLMLERGPAANVFEWHQSIIQRTRCRGHNRRISRTKYTKIHKIQSTNSGTRPQHTPFLWAVPVVGDEPPHPPYPTARADRSDSSMQLQALRSMPTRAQQTHQLGPGQADHICLL